MDSKPEVIKNYVRAYQSLTKIPVVEFGQILSLDEDYMKVTTIWKQRNLDLGKMIKFQKNFFINTSTAEIIYSSPPSDVTAQEKSVFSNPDSLQCIVRKSRDDNKKKQYLEIWTNDALSKSFDINAIDVHGEIYCDAEFGSLEWSPQQDRILYIAEKKKVKSEPFYKQKPADVPDDDKAVKGEEYVYKPDWGEQLVDKHESIIGICDLKTDTIHVLKGFPANFCPAQVYWSKDGSGIFGVVYDSEPRPLGLMFCTSRNSYIFYLTLKGDFRILSDPNKAVRSPRIAPDGKQLFWLQRLAGGPHDGCLELIKLDLTTGRREVLIETIRNCGKSFSGLYLHELPKRCFSADGSRLFFTSVQKYRNALFYLDLGTKEVVPVETGDGSATILDIRGNIILLSTSSLQLTPSLKMMKITHDMELISITEADIICPQSVFKEIEFHTRPGKYKYTYFNALFYGPSPKTISRVPLILCVHGGPHSIFLNAYSLDYNFLVKVGYGLLLVNYRGSTGVGQEGIEFLLGKIGDSDVRDAAEALQYTLKAFTYLDEKNVFLYGGSHGGFLVEHLSAQYPDTFRATVARNPVTNLLGMYNMSDIPDWPMYESGMVFDEGKPIPPEQAQKLLVSSPISLSDKIKTPTLFLIGKNDKRVPLYEGLKMYHSLRARKVKVRLNLYDDNHTLGDVPHHIDCLINAALWFHENKSA